MLQNIKDYELTHNGIFVGKNYIYRNITDLHAFLQQQGLHVYTFLITNLLYSISFMF